MPYSALQAITGIIKANGGSALEQQQTDPLTAAEFTEFEVLTKKAINGDTTVLPVLRVYLDREPDFWQNIGNTGALIQQTCIDRMYGKDEVAKECVKRTTAAFIRELEGLIPSPLETLLAQQIALDRLYLQKLEYMIDLPGHDRTIAQSKHHDRRVTAAHNRYMKAIKTLAQVRKLLGPTVQVNIAQQQVNVATGGGLPLAPDGSTLSVRLC